VSIRLRLTLLYSGILAVTLIVFSTTLFVSQSRVTYDAIKANLTRQAIEYTSGPRHFSGPFSQPPDNSPQAAPSGSQSTGASQSSAPSASGVAAGRAQTGGNPSQPFTLPDGTLPGRWTQTRSLGGTVLARTYDLSGVTLPLNVQGLQAVQAGQGWYQTAVVQDQPLLIYSRVFTTTTATREIIQIAFPISQPEASLGALKVILVAGSSVAILIAVIMGWVLAGTALGPIQRITQTAEAIGAERDFDRRVLHKGPNDEVGRLASTFNGMLAELATAFRQMKDSLDSQRRFVADASHELRTPLTTVRGNMELLRREPPVAPAERGEILADTTDEVDRLIRLVNQLLVLARADAGQSVPLSPLPLQPLMEDVYRQAKALAPNREVTCESPDDVQALGNRDALKQVLLILVDNAFKHTSPGATLTLSAAAADGRVAITVRDTGRGIAPDMLPHIFERFYRGETSRSGDGTGLGLAIAKELMETQGGDIAVQSRLGEGSAFTVTLRCVDGVGG
jgi:two-component system, OmpR family, sensor kinase